MKSRTIAVKAGGYLEERRWRNREVTAGKSKVGEELGEKGKSKRKRR
jgi:hypothetical protein